MSLAVLRSGSAAKHDADYQVRVDAAWESAREDFRTSARNGLTSPFQRFELVDCWYRSMQSRASVEPLLVRVCDAQTGAMAVHLPLIRCRVGAMRVIRFADEGVVDYNAPIIGPAAARTRPDAARLWNAIQRHLPPADLLDLRKMPISVGRTLNPLALLPTLPSPLNGNLLRIADEDDFAAYTHKVLERRFRKELERSWRVFTRYPSARFALIEEPQLRRDVLAAVERQQPVRLQRAGKRYDLDRPDAADFYRRLVDSDPAGSFVAIGALMAEQQVIAALVGLRSGASFTMIRISSVIDPAWTNCSPGRLVIARMMAALREQGICTFDFSLGNDDYKRRFGVQSVPLVDLVRPLSPLGLLDAAAAYGKSRLRRHPNVERIVRRMLGRHQR